MSAQDSTMRLLFSMRHPTTGTGCGVVRRDPLGACTGTRAGSQRSEPSIRTLACFPVRGSPSDLARIIAVPKNGSA